MHFTDYFKRGTHNTLQFNNSANLSFKGPATRVYADTEIDSWYVGDFSSASYHITVEFDSNQKETLQVLVIARPGHASYTIFGRISIDAALITLSASVTDSKMTLTANPTDPVFLGARVIFTATYSETISPLTLPTVVSNSPGSGGGSGGSGSGGLIITNPAFGVVSALGQSNITATTQSDHLTFLSGSGINITTDSVGKSLTFSSSLHAFNNIVVTGYPALSPSSSTDTLTFTAGNGVLLNTNSLTKTITISSPVASTTTLGSVKVDGTSITINNGVISSAGGGGNFVLPTATTSVLGGVKVDGTSITVTSDGVISAAGGGGGSNNGLTLTSVKSTNYVASAYELVNADTTNNAISVTLPTNPQNGTVVGIIDALGKFGTFPLYVYPGTGATIENDNTLILDVANTYITFIYISSNTNWRLQSTPSLTVYGINTVSTSSIYDNPTWINSISYSKITGAPTAYSLPTATTSMLGGVKIDGTSITISDGVISSTSSYALPTATTSVLGGVKVDGSTITIANGVISSSPQYTLPTATTSVLGGVKVDGSTITISNGVISGSISYTLPTATTSVLGGVKVDGSTITIANGVISSSPQYTLPTATTSVLGGVKVDGSTITITNGVISGSSTYTLPTATTSILGGVKVDGSTITITNGVISGSSTYTLPTASASVLGGVKVGSGLAIDGSSVLSVVSTLSGGLYPTAIKTSSSPAYTAVANDLVRCDTSTGAFSITFPTSPTDGSIIGIVDVGGAFGTANLTINRGGTTTIEGNTSYILDVDGAYISFVYNSTGAVWKLLDAPITAVLLPVNTGSSTNITGLVKGDGSTLSTVVSGTDIKTVNSTSLLGSGNVAVQATLVSGTNIKTIHGASILGAGDLVVPEPTTTLSSTTATLTIDLTTFTTTTLIVTCDTTANQAKTFNFTGTPDTMISTNIFSINVIVKNNVAISSLTWQRAGVAGNIKWSNGVIPPATLTAIGTGGYDVWTFFTTDGGSTFAGSLSMYGVR